MPDGTLAKLLKLPPYDTAVQLTHASITFHRLLVASLWSVAGLQPACTVSVGQSLIGSIVSFYALSKLELTGV